MIDTMPETDFHKNDDDFLQQLESSFEQFEDKDFSNEWPPFDSPVKPLNSKRKRSYEESFVTPDILTENTDQYLSNNFVSSEGIIKSENIAINSHTDSSYDIEGSSSPEPILHSKQKRRKLDFVPDSMDISGSFDSSWDSPRSSPEPSDSWDMERASVNDSHSTFMSSEKNPLHKILSNGVIVDKSETQCRACHQNLKGYSRNPAMHFMKNVHEDCWKSVCHDLEINDRISTKIYPPQYMEKVDKNTFRCRLCHETGKKWKILSHLMGAKCEQSKKLYRDSLAWQGIDETTEVEEHKRTEPVKYKLKKEKRAENPLKEIFPDSKDDSFSCMNCNKKLSSQDSLYSHIATFPECWEKFVEKSGRDAQKIQPRSNLIKSGEKFTCTQCGLRTGRKSANLHVVANPCKGLRELYGKALKREDRTTENESNVCR